jgi:hypothetical protein
MTLNNEEMNPLIYGISMSERRTYESASCIPLSGGGNGSIFCSLNLCCGQGHHVRSGDQREFLLLLPFIEQHNISICQDKQLCSCNLKNKSNVWLFATRKGVFFIISVKLCHISF